MLKYDDFLLELINSKRFKKPWINSLPDDVSISQLYEYVNHIAKKLGEELTGEETFLGEGDYGTAFELKSGRVLKLTGDSVEAKIAEWMTNFDTEYLIDYYKIVEIKDHEPKIFAIVMDKVRTIRNTVNMRIVWEHILTYINKEPEIILTGGSDELIDEIFDDEDMTRSYEWVEKYINKNWDSIHGITYEVIKFGLEFPDLHPGNLGYDESGKLIYFDVREGVDIDMTEIKIPKLDLGTYSL